MMDFMVLLADLRDLAEKYKGKSTEPHVAMLAYVEMFTKILRRARKATDVYNDQITVLWVALNQLASIYKDLLPGQPRDQLCKFIFGLCAKTVLNIQWSQLDQDHTVKKNFCVTVENVNEILSQHGFNRFQLILELMESHWTHPVLSKIMSGDDVDTEDCQKYIQKEDPEVLKLRIEIMINENCEEFALNLCTWSLKHKALDNDLTIKEFQICILYKQGEYGKMQEVCETIVCHDGIKVMAHLAKVPANQELCIRLAQVFLIQDWVKPIKTCCTQELLKLWIHHQYLADKDEERFLDSLWMVAKVCRDTEQIGVLIDGVKKECGDMFIQMYTELCQYAVNIDKGNMEREHRIGNEVEVKKRKLAMSKTCVRMAFMLKEYDFRISRVCGLTAFALDPTMDNLNLVNKLYWTFKDTSAVSVNSKINIATLYEIERLLNQIRPEILNSEYSWKQLIPLCKMYKQECENGTFGKHDVRNTPTSVMPQICTVTSSVLSSNTGEKQNIKPGSVQQNTVKYSQPNKPMQVPNGIHQEHIAKLIMEKNLICEQIDQDLSQQFSRNIPNVANASSLTKKELDKTSDALKRSIYLEMDFRRQTSEKNQSPLEQSIQLSASAKNVNNQSQRRAFQNDGALMLNRQQNVPTAHAAGFGSEPLHPQLCVNTFHGRPPSAHSHHRLPSSPIAVFASSPPAYTSLHQIVHPTGFSAISHTAGRKPDVTSLTVIDNPMSSSAHTSHKTLCLSQSYSQPAVSNSVPEQLCNKNRGEMQLKKLVMSTTQSNIPHPVCTSTQRNNILCPAGTSEHECTKIAQQIVQLNECQRSAKETLEMAHLQKQLDSLKAILNARNNPSKSPISDIPSLSFQGDKRSYTTINCSAQNLGHNSDVLSKTAMKIPATATVTSMHQVQSVSSPQQLSKQIQENVVLSKTVGTPSYISTNARDRQHIQKGLRAKQKYVITTDKNIVHKLKFDSFGNVNIVESPIQVQPLVSVVVPRSLTNHDRVEELKKTIGEMISKAAKVHVHSNTTLSSQVQLSAPATIQAQQPLGSYAMSHYVSTSTSLPLENHLLPSVNHLELLSNTSAPLPITTNSAQPVKCNHLNTDRLSKIIVSTQSQPNVSAGDVATMDPGLLQNLETLAPTSVSIGDQVSSSQLQAFSNQESMNQLIGASKVNVTQSFKGMPHIQLQPPQLLFATPLCSVPQSSYGQSMILQQHSNFNSLVQQPTTVHNNFSSEITQTFVTVPQLKNTEFNDNMNSVRTGASRLQMPMQESTCHIQTMTPELSPVWQQILSSLDHISGHQSLGSKQNTFGKPVEVSSYSGSFTENATNWKPKYIELSDSLQNVKHGNIDPIVTQRVEEATQKIRELQKKYGHVPVPVTLSLKALPFTVSPPQITVSESTNGYLQRLMNEEMLQPPVSLPQNIPNCFSQLSSSNKSIYLQSSETLNQQSIPDLPDLGAKEFQIDQILALDTDGLGSSYNSMPQQNEIISSSVTSKRKNSSTTDISTISHSKSHLEDALKVMSDQDMLSHFQELFNTKCKRKGEQNSSIPPAKRLSESEHAIEQKNVCQFKFMNVNKIAEDRESNSKSLVNAIGKNISVQQKMNIVKCEKCSLYFRTNEQLTTQICCGKCATSPKQSPQAAPVKTRVLIACTKCGLSFDCPKMLNNHIENYCLKNPESVRKCPKCYYYFQSSEQLQNHLKMATCINHSESQSSGQPEKIQCGNCEMLFKSMNEIKQHVNRGCFRAAGQSTAINEVHEFSLVYRCSNCNFINSDKNISAKHFELCSLNTKVGLTNTELITMYRCNMCFDVFNDMEVTSMHILKQCPKHKIAENQKQVQEVYQKHRRTNKLQLSASDTSISISKLVTPSAQLDGQSGDANKMSLASLKAQDINTGQHDQVTHTEVNKLDGCFGRTFNCNDNLRKNEIGKKDFDTDSIKTNEGNKSKTMVSSPPLKPCFTSNEHNHNVENEDDFASLGVKIIKPECAEMVMKETVQVPSNILFKMDQVQNECKKKDFHNKNKEQEEIEAYRNIQRAQRLSEKLYWEEFNAMERRKQELKEIENKEKEKREKFAYEKKKCNNSLDNVDDFHNEKKLNKNEIDINSTNTAVELYIDKQVSVTAKRKQTDMQKKQKHSKKNIIANDFANSNLKLTDHNEMTNKVKEHSTMEMKNKETELNSMTECSNKKLENTRKETISSKEQNCKEKDIDNIFCGVNLKEHKQKLEDANKKDITYTSKQPCLKVKKKFAERKAIKDKTSNLDTESNGLKEMLICSATKKQNVKDKKLEEDEVSKHTKIILIKDKCTTLYKEKRRGKDKKELCKFAKGLNKRMKYKMNERNISDVISVKLKIHKLNKQKKTTEKRGRLSNSKTKLSRRSERKNTERIGVQINSKAHSPQDVRKLKGLRAKKLLKKQKFLIDEMEPIYPTRKVSEKIKNILHSNQATKGVHDKMFYCKYCDYVSQQKGNRFAENVFHYIHSHNLGFKFVRLKYTCKFCSYSVPSSKTMAIKHHVYSDHKKEIMQQIIKCKLDNVLCEKQSTPQKADFMKIERGKSVKSQMSNLLSPLTLQQERLEKHLRAEALRRLCAEKLKGIAYKKSCLENDGINFDLLETDDNANTETNAVLNFVEKHEHASKALNLRELVNSKITAIKDEIQSLEVSDNIVNASPNKQIGRSSRKTIIQRNTKMDMLENGSVNEFIETQSSTKKIISLSRSCCINNKSCVLPSYPLCSVKPGKRNSSVDSSEMIHTWSGRKIRSETDLICHTDSSVFESDDTNKKVEQAVEKAQCKRSFSSCKQSITTLNQKSDVTEATAGEVSVKKSKLVARQIIPCKSDELDNVESSESSYNDILSKKTRSSSKDKTSKMKDKSLCETGGNTDNKLARSKLSLFKRTGYITDNKNNFVEQGICQNFNQESDSHTENNKEEVGRKYSLRKFSSKSDCKLAEFSGDEAIQLKQEDDKIMLCNNVRKNSTIKVDIEQATDKKARKSSCSNGELVSSEQKIEMKTVLTGPEDGEFSGLHAIPIVQRKDSLDLINCENADSHGESVQIDKIECIKSMSNVSLKNMPNALMDVKECAFLKDDAHLKTQEKIMIKDTVSSNEKKLTAAVLEIRQEADGGGVSKESVLNSLFDAQKKHDHLKQTSDHERIFEKMSSHLEDLPPEINFALALPKFASDSDKVETLELVKVVNNESKKIEEKVKNGFFGSLTEFASQTIKTSDNETKSKIPKVSLQKLTSKCINEHKMSKQVIKTSSRTEKNPQEKKKKELFRLGNCSVNIVRLRHDQIAKQPSKTCNIDKKIDEQDFIMIEDSDEEKFEESKKVIKENLQTVNVVQRNITFKKRKKKTDIKCIKQADETLDEDIIFPNSLNKQMLAEDGSDGAVSDVNNTEGGCIKILVEGNSCLFDSMVAVDVHCDISTEEDPNEVAVSNNVTLSVDEEEDDFQNGCSVTEPVHVFDKNQDNNMESEVLDTINNLQQKLDFQTLKSSDQTGCGFEKPSSASNGFEKKSESKECTELSTGVSLTNITDKNIFNSSYDTKYNAKMGGHESNQQSEDRIEKYETCSETDHLNNSKVSDGKDQNLEYVLNYNDDLLKKVVDKRNQPSEICNVTVSGVDMCCSAEVNMTAKLSKDVLNDFKSNIAEHNEKLNDCAIFNWGKNGESMFGSLLPVFDIGKEHVTAVESPSLQKNQLGTVLNNGSAERCVPSVSFVSSKQFTDIYKEEEMVKLDNINIDIVILNNLVQETSPRIKPTFTPKSEPSCSEACVEVFQQKQHEQSCNESPTENIEQHERGGISNEQCISESCQGMPTTNTEQLKCTRISNKISIAETSHKMPSLNVELCKTEGIAYKKCVTEACQEMPTKKLELYETEGISDKICIVDTLYINEIGTDIREAIEIPVASCETTTQIENSELIHQDADKFTAISSVVCSHSTQSNDAEHITTRECVVHSEEKINSLSQNMQQVLEDHLQGNIDQIVFTDPVLTKLAEQQTNNEFLMSDECDKMDPSITGMELKDNETIFKELISNCFNKTEECCQKLKQMSESRCISDAEIKGDDISNEMSESQCTAVTDIKADIANEMHATELEESCDDKSNKEEMLETNCKTEIALSEIDSQTLLGKGMPYAILTEACLCLKKKQLLPEMESSVCKKHKTDLLLSQKVIERKTSADKLSENMELTELKGSDESVSKMSSELGYNEDIRITDEVFKDKGTSHLELKLKVDKVNISHVLKVQAKVAVPPEMQLENELDKDFRRTELLRSLRKESSGQSYECNFNFEDKQSASLTRNASVIQSELENNFDTAGLYSSLSAARGSNKNDGIVNARYVRDFEIETDGCKSQSVALATVLLRAPSHKNSFSAMAFKLVKNQMNNNSSERVKKYVRCTSSAKISPMSALPSPLILNENKLTLKDPLQSKSEMIVVKEINTTKDNLQEISKTDDSGTIYYGLTEIEKDAALLKQHEHIKNRLSNGKSLRSMARDCKPFKYSVNETHSKGNAFMNNEKMQQKSEKSLLEMQTELYAGNKLRLCSWSGLTDHRNTSKKIGSSQTSNTQVEKIVISSNSSNVLHTMENESPPNANVEKGDILKLNRLQSQLKSCTKNEVSVTGEKACTCVYSQCKDVKGEIFRSYSRRDSQLQSKATETQSYKGGLRSEVRHVEPIFTEFRNKRIITTEEMQNVQHFKRESQQDNVRIPKEMQTKEKSIVANENVRKCNYKEAECDRAQGQVYEPVSKSVSCVQNDCSGNSNSDSEEPPVKMCKLDGTSKSPDKSDSEEYSHKFVNIDCDNCIKKNKKTYKAKRKPSQPSFKKVGYGGRVFKIDKGKVNERDLKEVVLKHKNNLEPGADTTSNIQSRLRPKVVKNYKALCRPHHSVDLLEANLKVRKNTKGPGTRYTKCNISATLNEITKQKEKNKAYTPARWTVHGGKGNSKTFPYAFKYKRK